MQFLAGALNRPIVQEIEDEPTSSAQGIYQLVMSPCSCSVNWNEMIGVFWMRMSVPSDDEEPSPMNHIAPLIPGSSKVLPYTHAHYYHCTMIPTSSFDLGIGVVYFCYS